MGEHNERLQRLYQEVYAQGSNTFYTFPAIRESREILNQDTWTGKTVLEVGCGEGGLASMIGFCGGQVLAIDYAASAIDIATQRYNLENVEFRCANYQDISGTFDIIVLQGVLEHMDDPLATLRELATRLHRPGKIITSSPSFLNPRGYIWMALQLLLDVPMSLSDVHFLSPFDLEAFSQQLGATLSYTSTDQDWGHGERLLVDFNKRLRNAFRDRGMEADVDRLLAWLEQTLPYTNYTQFSGATVVYQLHFDATVSGV
jgi:SAM-dependent methyltransferase